MTDKKYYINEDSRIVVLRDFVDVRAGDVMVAKRAVIPVYTS